MRTNMALSKRPVHVYDRFYDLASKDIHDGIEYHHNNDFQGAILLLLRAYHFFSVSKHFTKQLLVLYYLGSCYFELKKIKKAYEYFSKALILANTIKDEKNIQACNENLMKCKESLKQEALKNLAIGINCNQKGEHKSAIEHLEKSQECFLTLDIDLEKKFLNLYYLGCSFLALNCFQVALKYFNNAYELAKSSGKIHVECQEKMELCKRYIEAQTSFKKGVDLIIQKKNFKVASRLFNEVKEEYKLLSQQKENVRLELADTLQYLGVCYLKKEKPSFALGELDEALEIYKELKLIPAIVSTHFILGLACEKWLEKGMNAGKPENKEVAKKRNDHFKEAMGFTASLSEADLNAAYKLVKFMLEGVQKPKNAEENPNMYNIFIFLEMCEAKMDRTILRTDKAGPLLFDVSKKLSLLTNELKIAPSLVLDSQSQQSITTAKN